jgi:hypothetical protein
MTLPAIESEGRRSCRKRCMGCDPCWICRRSYPASLSIDYIGSSGSSGSSGGASITGWFGCCGLAAGTYVPLTPHGQDVTVDNGVTEHRTFKAPYDLGLGGAAVPGCIAYWRWKGRQFQQGWIEESIEPPLPRRPYYPIESFITRCQGTDNDPIDYWKGLSFIEDPTSSFAVEFVRDLEVAITVGNWPFFDLSLGDPRIAKSLSSTQIDCTITTRYYGEALILSPPGGGFPYGNARYDILRKETYRKRLSKPCPESGTFTLEHVGSGTLFGGLTNNIYGTGNVLLPVTIPECVLADESYAVSISL